MAAKTYYLRFGSGNPATYSGLSPSFIVFRNAAGVTTAPGITEISTTGLYYFDYECTGTVGFVVDGATTGLATADRYIAGSLDISDRLSEFVGFPSDSLGFSSLFGQVFSVLGQGNTLTTRVGAITDVSGFSTLFGQVIQVAAQSSTLTGLVGDTSSAIGDNSTDPTTLFGFLMRCDNVLEGDSDYTKATGVFRMLDKTGATLLASKTITDASGVITKD